MGAKSVAKFAPDNTSKWESRVDLIGQMTRNGSTLQFLPLVSKTCGSGSSAHLEFCQSSKSKTESVPWHRAMQAYKG